MERKNEIILKNTTLENVFQYLLNKLNGLSGSEIERTSDDGTIQTYMIQNVFPSSPNKIDVRYTTTVIPQGNLEKAHGYWEILIALKFEGLQLQENTVLIKGECDRPIFVSIFDRYWDDMLKAFGATKPIKIDQENITWGELEEQIEIGNQEAIQIRGKILSSIKDDLQDVGQNFQKWIDESFEHHPSKPVYDMIKGMLESPNPVHRATASVFQNMTLGEIKANGAKWLALELSKSGNELPPPRDKTDILQISAAKPKNKPLPRVPKQPKRLNDWKVAWRKVKGRWKNGGNYMELAQAANCSTETIADIVKAGDAGLLD